MTSHNVPHRGLPTRWLGWVIFAGVVLLVVGVVQVIYGIAAFTRSGNSLATPVGTPALVHVGWAYVVLGVVLAAAGVGVMSGWMWARVVAIAFAVLSLLTNVAFFLGSPVWSSIVIVLDLIVIYALALHGKEVKGIR
ncbi:MULTISPECIES: DUF7144 family membrane protein [Saccharopolyspora]|uniref:DUF7144 domain-containing protein n=1 Tax=Saccharopolyspora elongata TaxID=2530387 RepID=A0A4R4XX17_9PSEU|nr:hypothetical protein [Saccharopolyspora elongata]TDD35684.1 hypothetical protein E1288_42840 [Saccharopolyspora elongata]